MLRIADPVSPYLFCAPIILAANATQIPGKGTRKRWNSVNTPRRHESITKRSEAPPFDTLGFASLTKGTAMQSLVRSFLAYFVLVASGALGVVFSVPLVLSFRLRQWFFARIYRVVQAIFDECWNPMRKDVMAYLDNMQSHDEELREKGVLRVLELGAAYGGNFPFIRRRIEYWNVDPNKDFQTAFRQQLKKYPKVQLKRHIIGYGEDMHELPDEYFDAVVMTFVLCSAKDGAKVLQEVKRVLAKVRPCYTPFNNLNYRVAYAQSIPLEFILVEDVLLFKSNHSIRFFPALG